jgi:hypothetical protein
MKRFKLRDESSRGAMCPRFLLPVYRRESHDRLVTWFFPLAPFALAGHIIASA